jgi:hypothetical protein
MLSTWFEISLVDMDIDQQQNKIDTFDDQLGRRSTIFLGMVQKMLF